MAQIGSLALELPNAAVCPKDKQTMKKKKTQKKHISLINTLVETYAKCTGATKT